MFIDERDPKFLIENGFLEKVDDFKKDGRTIQASRLGYRINESFISTYFGRMFSAPDTVFTSEMLRPEEQSEEDFIDGIENIVETQKKIASNYFKDGSIDLACPPLKALLHIMVDGSYEGKAIGDPEIRALFDRDHLLNSDWYQARLDAKVLVEKQLIAKKIVALEEFETLANYEGERTRLKVAEKHAAANERAEFCQTDAYRESLIGTIGTDPALLG